MEFLTSACCSPMVRGPLAEQAAVSLAAAFKALGDPVRLRLFSLVASHAAGEACVCDLTGEFDVSQPTISHHLKVLREAGLLTSERQASWVYYRVAPDALATLAHLLAAAPVAADPRPHGLGAQMAPTNDVLSDASIEALLRRIVERLAARFTGTFAPETIERYMLESYTSLLRTAKIRTHVPVLAEHFATDRLTALAQAKGALDKAVPEVLFVCVQNAGRSQMAAALTRHYGAGQVHVRSAGSLPASAVQPGVAAVVAELGLTLSDGDIPAYPKPLTDDVVQAADVVVTMGCGDACPIYPGKRYLDWDLDDPAGRSIDKVRAIRDDIGTRVRVLLADLTPDPAR